MNKYIIFNNDFNFGIGDNKSPYIAGVKYRIAKENKTQYIIESYANKLYVPKEYEDINYTVGEIITEWELK